MSTDADVASLHSLEVELGYFSDSRTPGVDAHEGPPLGLNYGFRDGLEASAEADASREFGSDWPIREPQLSLKTLLRKGALQNEAGPSLACETSLFLPSNREGEKRAGFQEAGMLSLRFDGMTFHANAGGGIERSLSLPFAVYGLVGERPVTKSLRLVGEINGQAIGTETPESSGLVGAIWEPGWRDAAFDLALRRGLSAIVPSWTLTAGVTFPISFAE